MMLPGMLAEPVAEDSLENTFSCVPKVQGDEPNLSGKRTENCMCVQFLYFCVFQQSLWGLLILL